MKIEESLRYALDGDAILFVGAGLSFLSRNKQGPLPAADKLIDILLDQTPGTGSKHGLARVAGKVLRDRGSEFVYDKLMANFFVTDVDPRLIRLYDVPWKRIYTTNYDNAPEVARTGKRPVVPVTLDDEQNKASVGSIIHLNGYINRVSPASLNERLALTDASYAASRLTESKWLSFFEHDMRTSRAVIFAGYSLYDLDIERVLLAAGEGRRNMFFFISPDADEIEISTLSQYGEVIDGGVDGLVKTIERVSTEYVPASFQRGYTSLRQLEPSGVARSPKSAVSALTEQLVYGLLPEDRVLSGEHVFADQPYIIDRAQHELAKKAIKEGPWRDILITGEMASGKSASTLALARYLIGQGYRVYYARKSQELQEDLRRLASDRQKTAVIFDGYAGFRPQIVDYASRRPLEHRIILAERSAMHEFISEFIEQTPHLGPTFEIVLDRISPADIPSFEAMTNFGGFWEERSGASVGSRQSYLSGNLEGSLHRLLLEIIKSRKVQDQIRELILPITNDNVASQVFCCALILNALKTDLMISEWQYLFPYNNVRSILQNYREQSRHFLSLDSNRVYTRSGLVSSSILHAFMDDILIRECLVKLYGLAQTGASGDDRWFSMRVELTRFGSLEPLFSDATKKSNILEYYDLIRPIGGTVNNPDYWLQLGIAATVLDDLDRGRLCFKNAYARERAKLRPNLVRIDNYSARFDMRCAADETNADAAFQLFSGAHEKIRKQIFLDSNRHYPFKVGRAFTDIAARHFEAWDSGKKMRFVKAASDMREKAVEWKLQKKQHSVDVDMLIRDMDALVRKLAG